MARACAVVVLRSGMILLVRRPDGWGFPDTPLADGESPAAAAARVLRERFGVEAGPAEAGPGAPGVAGVVVKAISGELKAADDRRWVEGRRLLEQELCPAHLPIAEALAAHRRRDRYKGTHPRSFAEKYKELAEDPEAVAKAKARGSTPAGGHVSIMTAEVLEALAPLSGATVLDCTLGAGGHAEALARAAGPAGRVIGLDRDGEELARTVDRLKARGVTILARRANYAEARAALTALGVEAADAVFADLGVSSMQLDRPERGMSFKRDGALDMRMDRSTGETAAEWLARATREEIASALKRYGDEPDAERVAAHLADLAARGLAPRTTRELASAVAEAKGLGPGPIAKKDAFSAHPATRTFQAVRIVVNREHEALERLLSDLPSLVKRRGRAAFLTFHSGEETLVREALRAQAAAGVWSAAPAEPRKPSVEEVRENPRARSARLWKVIRA